MYDSAVGLQVRASFKELVVKRSTFTDADSLRLRDRICAAVDELKSQCWPIERIIIRMKDLAWEVGLRIGNTANQADRHPALAQAVLWCVERYYAVDGQSPA